MLPIGAFISKITSPMDEDNDQEEILNAIYLAVGQKAQDDISKIVADGAEEVLDGILRDPSNLNRVSTKSTPNENNHERLDHENFVIFWSKSGVQPFVGVYEKHNPTGNDVQRTGESEMFEEPIKEIDMEAVEAASHFLLRGIDEDTVGRVVSDACRDCHQTDEAINKIRDIIREDPRLDGYALDEDEVSGLNEYRHKLRKSFLGRSSPEVLNQSLYEDDIDQIKNDEEDLNDDKMDVANAEAELAKRKAEIAQDKADGGSSSLFEGDIDPNKGSQMAGYRHAGGPEALSNAVGQMQWDGPGGSFDKFLNAIDVQGYNMIGNVAKAQAQGKPVAAPAQVNPQSPSAQPQAAPQAPQTQPNQELDDLELPSI